MDKKPNIVMTPLKSSAIAATGYDIDSRTMALQFKGGKTYRYANVPQSIHNGIREAKSAGQFVSKHVVGKFDLVKGDRKP